MTLNQLIEKANTGYPDDRIAQAHTASNSGCVGDSLAVFIAQELHDTFDPDASDEAQLQEAVRVLEVARRELEGVITVFQWSRRCGPDGSFNPRIKNATH